MNTRKKLFTKVSQLEVVGIGPSSHQKKDARVSLCLKKVTASQSWDALSQIWKLITQNFFGVRSFSTTPKEPQASHYGRRMMVSKPYLKPFSRYRWKCLRASAAMPQNKNFELLVIYFSVYNYLCSNVLVYVLLDTKRKHMSKFLKKNLSEHFWVVADDPYCPPL